MCSTEVLERALDGLAAEDLTDLSDSELATQLRAMLVAVNRLNAEVGRRVNAFDRRRLSTPDGCRSTASWLKAFGRMSGPVASSTVKRARIADRFPELTAATSAGEVSPEHWRPVLRMVDRVGTDVAARADSVLAQVARTCRPPDMERVCARVLVYTDPDGAEPDAKEDFARRGLTVTPFDGMVLIRGQLDPEGGAALTIALDALMTPPGEGDPRTPAQRRADALVELARGALREGKVPTVGGVRPQVAIVVSPDNLRATGFQHVGSQIAGSQIASSRIVGSRAVESREGEGEGEGEREGRGGDRDGGGDDERGDVGVPTGYEPAHMEWVGTVPNMVAQRVSCDADVWRVVLDPATGQPVDVGRAHRLVPHWIRKSLHTRDGGCRFPGCGAPAAWTDAHHVMPWANGGSTDLANLVLLCRFHHGLVHEGGWRIAYDQMINVLTVRRPNGLLYEIAGRPLPRYPAA